MSLASAPQRRKLFSCRSEVFRTVVTLPPAPISRIAARSCGRPCSFAALISAHTACVQACHRSSCESTSCQAMSPNIRIAGRAGPWHEGHDGWFDLKPNASTALGGVPGMCRNVVTRPPPRTRPTLGAASPQRPGVGAAAPPASLPSAVAPRFSTAPAISAPSTMDVALAASLEAMVWSAPTEASATIESASPTALQALACCTPAMLPSPAAVPGLLSPTCLPRPGAPAAANIVSVSTQKW
mmetsp:Transcript_69120/g.223435  ORF Transcript_69120/g.223435 Transcript_69120/m.223435 type:complete len:241 (+) Transcript_69120:243-965(+)